VQVGGAHDGLGDGEGVGDDDLCLGKLGPEDVVEGDRAGIAGFCSTSVSVLLIFPVS
jgi:hypothetical protein